MHHWPAAVPHSLENEFKLKGHHMETSTFREDLITVLSKLKIPSVLFNQRFNENKVFIRLTLRRKKNEHHAFSNTFVRKF